MKRNVFYLFVIFLLSFFHVTAQERTIEGIVTSLEDGEPLPGVNISIKGSSYGVITNSDGTYMIKVSSKDKMLIFSFIGMETKEILIGQKKKINVVLAPSSTSLDDILVTAMGIKKDKKSLGYAVQKVSSEKLLEGKQSNLVNALQGKVAGLTVTNSGGAPGASSVIMIRGGNSLSGNNQPLFIVDGIPIDNSTEKGGAIASSNRALDINSEDVESISILKGPAAAALYGIKAANGAVVITTKSGKSGEAIISYSGSISMDNVMSTPDVQMQYGQGTQLDDGTINNETTLSWSDTKLPSSAKRYNNLADFYQTAYTQNHNLSYSGGTEKNTIYFSTGYLNQKGVIDRTNYDRLSFKLKADSRLKKDLTVGASVNYVNSNSDRTRQGSANSGNFRSILAYPININMKDYLNPDGTQKFIEGLDDAPNDNPYWSAINNPINNRVDRFISIGNIVYNPFNFMNITYRIGTDIFFEKNKNNYAYGSSIWDKGYLGEYETFNQITTSTLLLNFNHKVLDNNFDLTLGNNVESSFYRKTYWSGKDFIEPDFIGINNIQLTDRNVGQRIVRKRIIGVFGELKYDWKNMLFLNLTGRYDKSSTLPKSNNGFFYPSLGFSVLASDLLKEMGVYVLADKLSYWKIRATWAQVGKDAPPHVLQTPMASSTNSYTVDPQGFIRSVYPTGNPGIKPEFTETFEIGTDIRLFNNRLGIDFSYFNSTSDEQILFVRMPPTASTYGGYLNGGSIKNEGVELLLNAKIIDNKDFSWTTNLNFAKISSTVKSLPGNIPQVEESDSWSFNSIAEGAAFLDGSLFGIYGKQYLRDDAGNLLLDDKGMVQVDTKQGNIGDRAPDWTLGITNTLKYKGFSLSFLWDIYYGNDVLNATKAAMVYYGLDPITLNRNTKKVFEGLRSTGNTDADGNIIYEKNTKEVVLDQDYYQDRYANVGENFVEDGSWLRLRYITLSYNFSKKLFKNKIQNAQIYVTGRNLLLFTKYSGIDPEVNTIGAAVKGTGSIGIDNLGTPSTKGFDLGIKVSF